MKTRSRRENSHCLYPLDGSGTFRKANRANWRRNTGFWLTGRMRHLADVRPVTAQLLKSLAVQYQLRPFCVIDMGCGDAWLLRLLRDCRIDADYIGLDFNSKLIHALARKYSGDKRALFRLADVERPLPRDLMGRAALVVNCFNFFELPNISRAFENAAMLLTDEGTLLVLTIDPLSQLLAISDDYADLAKNLRLYQQLGERAAYDKIIDVIGSPRTRLTYKGILYSAATFIRLAKDNSLGLTDYREVRSLLKWPPQVYQFLLFRPGPHGRSASLLGPLHDLDFVPVKTRPRAPRTER